MSEFKASEFKPLVSVLVPVYNVTKYLRQCLDSLVNQTLREIEIVCVNDGSTDSSPEILKEYAKSDDRIVIVNKQNGGLPSARNAGLDVAKGKYVAFVDGDDYVDVDMFRRMYNAARVNDADIVVCGGHLFPEEDKAPAWFKDALSPRNITYQAGCVEALFTERGAKPFLWRDLVRKELIDKNNFRLDESIVVGEDQAFQFKIFPAAQRVTFIEDKLYYYRYSRPESIMNEAQYKDYGARISKHVNMIESIAKSWQKQLSIKDSAMRFYEWAVDFVYWDLIRVSPADRIKIAKRFSDLLIGCGYYLYYKEYSWNTRNQFEYICNVAASKAEGPLVTIAVALGRCSDYLGNFLDSILMQSEKRIEVLLYENASDDATKNMAFDRLNKDVRICLRLGEWQPVSEKYNDAILTAKGKYICFLNAFDHIQNIDWLRDSIGAMQADETIGLVGYQEGFAGKSYVENCQNGYYRQFLYRTEKIRAERIRFKDYALLTGSVFFTKYCLACEYAYFIPKFMMKGKTLKRQNIYADEAKLVMRAFVELLRAAQKNDLFKLAERVSDLLNSENYARLITDSTYGFYLDKSSVNNPREDFHSEVLSLLVEANSLARLAPGDNSVLRTLSMFIAKRHQFLEKI